MRKHYNGKFPVETMRKKYYPRPHSSFLSRATAVRADDVASMSTSTASATTPAPAAPASTSYTHHPYSSYVYHDEEEPSTPTRDDAHDLPTPSFRGYERSVSQPTTTCCSTSLNPSDGSHPSSPTPPDDHYSNEKPSTLSSAAPATSTSPSPSSSPPIEQAEVNNSILSSSTVLYHPPVHFHDISSMLAKTVPPACLVPPFIHPSTTSLSSAGSHDERHPLCPLTSTTSRTVPEQVKDEKDKTCSSERNHAQKGTFAVQGKRKNKNSISGPMGNSYFRPEYYPPTSSKPAGPPACTGMQVPANATSLKKEGNSTSTTTSSSSGSSCFRSPAPQPVNAVNGQHERGKIRRGNQALSSTKESFSGVHSSSFHARSEDRTSGGITTEDEATSMAGPTTTAASTSPYKAKSSTTDAVFTEASGTHSTTSSASTMCSASTRISGSFSSSSSVTTTPRAPVSRYPADISTVAPALPSSTFASSCDGAGDHFTPFKGAAELTPISPAAVRDLGKKEGKWTKSLSATFPSISTPIGTDDDTALGMTSTTNGSDASLSSANCTPLLRYEEKPSSPPLPVSPSPASYRKAGKGGNSQKKRKPYQPASKKEKVVHMLSNPKTPAAAAAGGGGVGDGGVRRLPIKAPSNPGCSLLSPLYASVNFRFGSAWFIAPFSCNAGDMVVVEYPSSQSLHMGIVSGVTTVKPMTFYSKRNKDPVYLSKEEIALLPRLLRRALPCDKEAKLALRDRDLQSLENAMALAMQREIPVLFQDAEWLFDGTALTFLVQVFGDVSRANDLADELATREGAEVVFTYPSV